MAHVDYEAAWVELGAWISATKTGYGRDEVAHKMAELAAKHSLPENFVQKIVRLYGDTIHIQVTPETGAAVLDESDQTVERKLPDPEASTTQGGHDERKKRAADERVGRGSDSPGAGRRSSRDQVTA